MQVNGVSSAGIGLVNRELQSSLAEANAAVAAQRQRSIDAVNERAEAAATVVGQQQFTGVSSRQVDVYL